MSAKDAIRAVAAGLAVMALVAAIGAGQPARAAEDLTVRGWDHGTFGRLVFDWGRPVGHEISRDDRRLTIVFDAPFRADYMKSVRALRRYVAGTEAAADGRGITLRLTGPMTYRSFVDSGNVAIDLMPAKVAPSGQAAGRVRVRAGEHKAFSRLVVDWPAHVPYRVDQQENRADIRFQATATLDLSDLEREVPQHFADATVLNEGKDSETTLRLTLRNDARLRHFRLGHKVVLDALPAPAAPAAPQTAEPLQPPQPLLAHGQASLDVAAAESSLGLVKLTFPWPKSVAAAAFNRAGYLWIVFDAPARMTLDQLKADDTRFNRQVQAGNAPSAAGGAAYLRLGNPSNYQPSLQRDGTHWIVELKESPAQLIKPVDVVTRPGGPAGGKVVLPVTDASRPVHLADPEVGDRLIVVPLKDLGQGLAQDRAFAQFTLLQSAQGLVVSPRVEALDVSVVAKAVEIGADGPLYLSSATQSALPAPDTAPGPYILPVEHWRGAPELSFVEKKQAIESALAAAPEADRNRLRLELAQLNFAFGITREAASLVDFMVSYDPRILEAPDVRALRGASHLMAGNLTAAGEDLGHSSLDDEPGIALWRAALAAAREEWGSAVIGFREAGERLLSLPAPYAVRLGLEAAEAAVQAGQYQTAQSYLAALQDQRLSAPESNVWAYLRGRVLAGLGRPEDALTIWEEVARGTDRRSRALAAFETVRLLLDLDRITPEEAIEELTRLRFAWRGDSFEFNLLRQMAGLQEDLDRPREALSTLRDAATAFAGRPEVPAITQRMGEIFQTLYLDGDADRLSPLEALSIYEEFRELTPAGAAGDRLVRNLAERLVAVDLLDQAASLLDHQIEFRLEGEEKAQAGQRLAEIRLLDNDPEAALGALAASEVDPVAASVAGVRGRLAARALNELGRGEEALTRLAGDVGPAAELLRAEIHMDAKAWKRAAFSYATYALEELGSSNELDPAAQRIILRWGMALGLAGDEQALGELRRKYEVAMTAGQFAKDFRALTSHEMSPPRTLDAVSARVAEAGAFASFLDSYRNRKNSTPDAAEPANE